MDIYAKPFLVAIKEDASPVTEADRTAQTVIVNELQALTPGVAIVAEEDGSALRDSAGHSCFWLVDPLDGTKEFINRNGEFTVNIALVEHGCVVLGVVLAPAKGQLFAGMAEQQAFVEEGGRRQTISCRTVPAEGLTVLASRSHCEISALTAFLDGHAVAAVKSAGSSLKLCLVAAGQADLYPRLGQTMEWDIAAGHAVLLAAGGQLTELSGVPLRYGKPGYNNPHFVARGLSEL